MGEIDRDPDDFLTDYLTAGIDYVLHQDQKFRFFHNLFNGKAKQFYRN